MPTNEENISAIPYGFRKHESVESTSLAGRHNELCRGSLCESLDGNITLKPGWYDARKPVHSNFEFAKCYFNSSLTVRAIFNQARRLDFRSFLVEKCKTDMGAYLYESDSLYRNKYTEAGFLGSEAFRISFWSSDINTRPEEKKGDFLGYAVLKKEKFKLDGKIYTNYLKKLEEIYGKDAKKAAEEHYKTRGCFDGDEWYVYEAILKPTLHNTFLRCKRLYEVEYEFGRYKINAALYAQQNGRTFVCAQAALRTVLSLMLPEGDITYDRINELAEVTEYPCEGLFPEQIDKVLAKHDIITRDDSIDLTKGEDYRERLYGHIESGCPCLLAFCPPQGEGHIVPILGHTFDANSWVPYANKAYFGKATDYYSSSDWSNSFLIHDDNFGTYSCIPKDFFEEYVKAGKSENGEKPENPTNASDPVILWGLYRTAEALCHDAVKNRALKWVDQCWRVLSNNLDKYPHKWLENFIDFAESKHLSYRFICISGKEYINYIESIRIELSIIDAIKNCLPNKKSDTLSDLWMVEISCPQLFAGTQAKFGEMFLSLESHNPVLSSVNRQPIPELKDNDDGVLQHLIRLPGIVFVPDNKNAILKTSVVGHTPLWTD